ncbi:tetratricopeptide repeat protein [Nitrosovibrio tenuis]|nr:tetratricopeptide repeat protein [Nitrosovibrio tenuis]
MLFLRPIRCRECKERFWVRNPNAYYAAGALLGLGAMLIAAVWLIIEQNMGSQPIVAASKSEPEHVAMPGAGKSSLSAGELVSTPPADAKPLKGAQPAANAKPSPQSSPPPLKNRMDDHHFTVQLYQENAENGEADAQYKLGLLYLTGNGALQDFAEAAKWLKRAAEQGYALAQYELGLIYRTGYGLAIDHVQSYVWLNLAAAAGIQQAVAARDEVMRSLSSKQLAQAQKTSREWLTSRAKSRIPNNSAAKAEPESEAGSLQ